VRLILDVHTSLRQGNLDLGKRFIFSQFREASKVLDIKILSVMSNSHWGEVGLKDDAGVGSREILILRWVKA